MLHAVGRASTGAVLVGDYLQNGPIVEESFPGRDDARKLFKTDCFTHFGATNPTQARGIDGCVVLTEQFRFGPALTELANRVAYRGLLTTAGNGHADIVVVTVDGLPEDITAIHRGTSKHAGWWLIGALLARALAEHHNDAGARDAFGVVVPYNAQVNATRAALEDSSLARLTPIGTSHFFQGRQFEVVLADLVEDGRARMVTADRLRDLMVTMDGARFADQLLQHELADELARRHRCPTCNDPLVECALTGKGRDRGWAWICPPPCNNGQGTCKPFPVAGTAAGRRRNDRSRT